MTTHSRWLITSSIPYVNAKPHLGFALEIIQADALARFHRSKGAEVRFLTGTDENSISNVRAAEELGLPVRDLVDRNAAAFRGLKERLGLSFDDFIRTSSDPRHASSVHRLWLACEDRGDIYRKTYRGLYCAGCELYYRRSEAVDGRCPNHLNPLEVVDEENYFFRLSRYEAALGDLISSERIRVVPQSRRNEALAFLSSGLEDISISRSAQRAQGWGIPVPGDDQQFIYVWFDALVNYISALGYSSDGEDFRNYWNTDARQIHVIGKDIIRQHAIYWPAFLLSAGLSVPSDIFVHGFLTFSGQKISKSHGTAIDVDDLVQRYGIDALRYYLLAKVPSVKDSDFSYEAFERVYRSDLADQLGNLVSRTTALLRKFSAGTIPLGEIPLGAEDLVDSALALPSKIEEAIHAFDFHSALDSIWDVIRNLNRFIVVARPWSSDEGSNEKRNDTLFLLAASIEWTARQLRPFLPSTADEILRRLGTEPSKDPIPFGQARFGRVKDDSPLFPKLVTTERVVT